MWPRLASTHYVAENGLDLLTFEYWDASCAFSDWLMLCGVSPRTMCMLNKHESAAAPLAPL